jgi:hypothetical protein
MKNTQLNQEQLTYNKAVKEIYFKMLKAAKELLSNIQDEPLRYSLCREDRHPTKRYITLHQFISPLLYLRLDLHNNEMCIHYGYETLPVVSPYYEVTASFIRIVYKLTMDDGVSTNIEQALRIDWVLTNTGDCYQHLEEMGHKQHLFKLVKFKPRQIKRKLRRVA